MAAKRKVKTAVDILPYHEMTLPEFMVSRGQSDPLHLRPFTDSITTAVLFGGRLRTVVEAPRQHGKTTVALYGAAWALLRRPELDLAYITYGQTYSGKRSREIRSLFVDCGGAVSPDHNTIEEWRTTAGGGLLATSPGGSLTGHGLDLAFGDDLLKGRVEAEVMANRDMIEEWMRGDLFGCLKPSASALLVASRYHEDDPSGRMVRECGWSRIRLPAICDDEDDPNGRAIGEALCPWGPDPIEPRDLAFLASKRAEVGEYDWESLYQCNPRPRGGAVFSGVAACPYESLPRMVRLQWGIDVAFSAGATGDRTALVLLGLGDDGAAYVLDCHSWRKGIVECESSVRAILATRPGVPIATYASGPEMGAYQQLARNGVRVACMPARLSKYVRAKRTAERWNAQDVRIVAGASWADELVRIVCGFTGLDGARDDEVDALVAAHDAMMGTGGAAGEGGFLMGRRRM